MSHEWADKIAHQLLNQGLIQRGVCLILGASDTGKTTLAKALANRAVSNGPVGIIDADIGQSHIGPPTTVGWALVDKPQTDFCQLCADGISFVGDITPVGHLLQLTVAIAQSVRQVSKVANWIIIDTPGFINGPAAAALWWTVQRLVQPELILAVQCKDELSDILSGLQGPGLECELVNCPSEIQIKSPQDRQSYRQKRFNEYFQNSHVYDITLSNIAVQPKRNLNREDLAGRLVALRDSNGVDIVIGLIINWRDNGDIAVVRAPEIDIKQICCFVIGDVLINING